MELKRIILFIFILISMSGFSKNQKKMNTDTIVPVMKQYYFVMLTKGANRSQDSATVAAIQKAHLENIERLSNEGKIIIAVRLAMTETGAAFLFLTARLKKK